MKQNPSKLKFKKNHKIKYSNLFLNEQKVFFPLYGNFALKALDSGKLTFKQIEACRKSIRRDVKKLGNVYIRAFTYFSITKKAVGIRMGKGKGNHFLWVCPIRSGQIICELSGIEESKALFALNSASSKLPIKAKAIKLFY